MRVLRVALSIFFVLSSVGALAAPKPAASKKATSTKAAPMSSGVSAVIRTDGAMVYSKPDFDAEVLTTLTQGQKVRVSPGTTGQVVKFHKVRVGPVLGYVAEIDVQVEGGVKKRDHKRGAGKNKKSGKASAGNERDRARAQMAEEKKKRDKLPFAFTRYVGLFVGVAGYKEEIGGSKKSDSLLLYGLKMTGPGILFEGPILDINLMLHYGAPKGYTEISTVKPSGYLLMSDTLLLLPMLQKSSFLGTLGVGPLITYRSFKVVRDAKFETFGGLSAGLSLAAAAGFRKGDYAIRAEAKYLVEKRVDTIFQLSLQNEF